MSRLYGQMTRVPFVGECISDLPLTEKEHRNQFLQFSEQVESSHPEAFRGSLYLIETPSSSRPAIPPHRTPSLRPHPVTHLETGIRCGYRSRCSRDVPDLLPVFF